ncbi:MAG: acyl carrier protein [Flavobacteriales bacterium]
MLNITEVEAELKEFILEEFLPDEDAEDLTNDIELISTGILDSVSVIKVIAYIEGEYSIVIEPAEANAANMNSIEAMAKLIQTKTA